MLKDPRWGRIRRLHASLAALVPCLLTLSLFALQGCGSRMAAVQADIENQKSRIESAVAAPAVAHEDEPAKPAVTDSTRDQLADAGGGYVELIELPQRNPKLEIRNPKETPNNRMEKPDVCVSISLVDPVALAELQAAPVPPPLAEEGGGMAAPQQAVADHGQDARATAPEPISIVKPPPPVSVGNIYHRDTETQSISDVKSQPPVSVSISLVDPVPLAELQAAPVPPPLAGDGGGSAAPQQAVADHGQDARATAAEPAPVAQSQAPAISLQLDTTELQPGAKLFGQVCGSWGADVARLLWVDGMGRVVGELGLKPAGEDSNSSAIPFGLAQPEGSVGQWQQLVVVRASKGALAKSEKEGTPVVYDIAAQAAFRVLPPARSLNDYAVLLGDGCESASPAFWRGLGRNGIQGGVIVSLEPGLELARHGSLFLSNALPLEGNPLHLGGNWTARLRAYAASREAKLLERQPPLFDEKVLAAVRAGIGKSVALKSGVPPLGWSLGDRLSLTQDAHPFDYDMSLRTLEVFRLWLEESYGSLSALNRQWGTEHKSWGEVKPPTTDAAKAANSPVYAECLKGLTSPPPPPPPPPAETPAPSPAPTGERPPAPPKADETPPAAPKAGETPAAQPPAPPPLPEAKWEEREGLKGFSLAPAQLSAPGHENFSAWSDWRAFCDFAFARLLREYRALAREAAHRKDAAAGLLGAEAPSAWGGWDYNALAKSVDWIEEHDSIVAREMFRSFAPAAPCFSSFSSSQEADLRRLWDRWLRGDSGCILQQYQRWLAPPDYQPAPAAKAFFAELHCLSDGLTLLRGQALPENDAVALYYSPRSVQLHWMMDSEAEGSWWLNRDGSYEAAHGSALLQMSAWWSLLEDLGYAPRFVSPPQLLAGELLPRNAPGKAAVLGVKVLVLPKVLALSDDEAEAVRRFARAGGVVIADGACGTFDGHGKRRQSIFVSGTGLRGMDTGAIGNLDRDFGIVRRDLRVLERNGAFVGDDAACLSFRGGAEPLGPESSELRILEPGVCAGEARGHAVSRGGTGALFTAAANRGRFVYLNLAMQDYPQLRARRSAGDFRFQGMSAEEYAKTYGPPTGGEALRLVVSDILSEALPESPLRVRAPDGTPPRGIKRVRFNLGKDAWLFSLLPTGPTGLATELRISEAPSQDERKLEEVWVGLEKQSYWYDVRAGLGLGSAAMVKTALDPNRPALLAALPYHAGKLKLKVRRTNPRGVFKVEAGLEIASGEPVTHVFHVEMTGPDGQLLPHYTRNVIAGSGRWATEFALALNEPEGTYQLTVRDALTGNSATGSLLKDSAEYTSFSTPLKP